MEAIIASEFDITKVAYGVPRTLDSGAKHIRVSYKRGPLTVQTPEMLAPFGINKWDNPGAPSKHSLELSFKDIEDRPELQDFKAMLAALDKKIIDDAFSGVLPTHNKKFTSRDVVEVLYQPLIKQKDEKYAPNFKMNLPVGDKDEFTFPTYALDPKTHEPKLVDLNAVQTKGAMCTVITQCTGIWVAGGSNFGCTFKATQLRVQPPVSKTDYAFKDVGKLLDHAEEVDLDETAAADDEDDEEEDLMETPVSMKAVAKPRASKAAK